MSTLAGLGAFLLTLTQSTLANSILRSDQVLLLQRASALRYFHGHGFKYCPWIENATFDSWAYVKPWGGTVAQLNPTMKEFVELIEGSAQRVHETVKAMGFIEPDATRFSCYLSASGVYADANVSASRLMIDPDPKNYMLPFLPAYIPANGPPPPTIKRKYGLAFVMTVHGESSMLENVKAVIDILDDGSAVFLIHVDLKSEDLFAAAQRWIQERRRNAIEFTTDSNYAGNVFLAKTRYTGIYKHVSLVRMHLNSMWELVDLADWDAVITISAMDFPLRTSKDIHTLITRDGVKGRNFMDVWRDSALSARRVMRPHLPKVDNETNELTMNLIPGFDVFWSPRPLWRLCVQCQWMILTRDFVQHLRTSIEAMTFLAYSEFSYVPDESYFCSVLTNDPKFKATLFNERKRFVYFYPNDDHASKLTVDWKHLFPEEPLGAEPVNYFIRRVDLTSDSGKVLARWAIDKHIRKHESSY